MDSRARRTRVRQGRHFGVDRVFGCFRGVWVFCVATSTKSRLGFGASFLRRFRPSSVGCAVLAGPSRGLRPARWRQERVVPTTRRTKLANEEKTGKAKMKKPGHKSEKI